MQHLLYGDFGNAAHFAHDSPIQREMCGTATHPVLAARIPLHRAIPIVEPSVDQHLTPAQMYDLGERLSPLRDEGIMVLGSGNVVHNLTLTDWRNMKGAEAADSFSDTVRDLVLSRDDETLVNYQKLDHANYAAPTTSPRRSTSWTQVKATRRPYSTMSGTWARCP